MEDEIDFFEYFLILKRNLLPFLIIFIVVFSGIVAYTLLRTRTYRSTGTVIFDGTKWELETQEKLIASPEFTDGLYARLGNFKIYARADKPSYTLELGAEADNQNASLFLASELLDSYLAFVNQTKSRNANIYLERMLSKKAFYEDIMANAPNDSDEYRDAQYQARVLNSKIDELSRNTQASIEKTRVIKSPELPQEPLSPVFKHNLILGLVLGAMMGMAGAVISDKHKHEKKGKKKKLYNEQP